MTISVPKQIKELLEKGKGNLDWGDYLSLLYKEYDRSRRVNSFNRLKNLLSEKEVERIKEEAREFRRQFRLR